MARNTTKATLTNSLKVATGNLSNRLFTLLGLQLFKTHEEFFIAAVKNIIRTREQEKIKRHDFADICVTLQSGGNIVDKETGLELKPTDELLAAQAFFFFIAGVEPTAQALYSTLLELGRNPEHLEKVHNEIDESFKKHNNKMDYDAVMNMTHLDMVLSEALRLHPPVGFITRRCVKDTLLPVGNIKVDKGTRIMTPIFAVHHDEKYYPEPEKFVPERFSPENKHKIIDVTYMPFGKGNRVCIGNRYALLQAKAGLVHLLRDFTVKTVTGDGGATYAPHPAQVRLSNINVEFIPRNPK
ncbi:unnamed protein product [Colias eurytheme]|nr:unnamed protein product [Colias eurytheme]